MKPYKSVTVEMMRELNIRRHNMEYSQHASLGIRYADGLLKKIIEFEKVGYFVPAEYGRSVFIYKEMIGNFVRTSLS